MATVVLLLAASCRPSPESYFDSEPMVRVLIINTLDEFVLTSQASVTITDQSTGAAIDSDTGIADADIRDEVREDADAAIVSLTVRLADDAIIVTPPCQSVHAAFPPVAGKPCRGTVR